MTWLSRLMRWTGSRTPVATDEERALLAPPEISALLPDIPGGEHNLLPRDAWLAPLPVTVPMWPNSSPTPNFPEYLWLYWNSVEVEMKTFNQDVTPADRIITVAPARLGEGEHELTYKVRTPNEQEVGSEPLTISIDKTPPILINDGPLIFAPAVIGGGVTEQYLKDNNDQVLAQIPAYLTPRPGDSITWYWSANPAGSEVVDSRTLVVADIGQPIMISFAGQLIRDRGDGPRYAFYKLVDRSGNDSPRSLAVQLQVSAQPVPRSFPPPRIKEASGSPSSSTLNPSRAINGATVQIPAEATINPGERVFVQWAAPGSVGSYRGEVPAGSLELMVPANKVPQHFGQSISVYYEVLESGAADPLVSGRHTLAVSAMTGWPTVQCDKVSGGQLKLANIADGGVARFTLERWSFMATEQFISVEVGGVDSSNQLLIVPILTESPVPEVAQVIDVGQISKVALQRFKINAQLDIRVKVSFNGKATWQLFPLNTPTLVN